MNPNPQARALNAIFRDLVNTIDGATYFAARVWGVHIHYDIAGSHPLNGYSVPNFEFEDGTTVGELLRDGKGVLLDFAGDDEIKSLAAKYSHQLNYVSRKAKDHSGLSAVLVRPDGFVAWAADDDPRYGELQNAVERWFVQDYVIS